MWFAVIRVLRREVMFTMIAVGKGEAMGYGCIDMYGYSGRRPHMMFACSRSVRTKAL